MALIAGIAGLAITAVDLGSFVISILGGKTVDPQKQTLVSIVIGQAPNGGGSVPDIYVRGPNGFQLARHSDKNGHLRESASEPFVMDNLPGVTLNNFNDVQVAQPHYVTLVATGSDAICVSAIIASGNAAQYMWTGDLGHYCGAEWYNSQFAFGSTSAPVKCVWLDGDHTNGIVASALSLHMTDFNGGLLQQYQEVNEAGEDIGDARLCKNSARMTFLRDWKIGDDERFQDVLKFNEKGEFVDPDIGIDREERAYKDGTDLPWMKNNGKAKRHHARDIPSASNRTSNPFPNHLTVSHLPTHSARLLCESDTSRGADFVTINDNETLFCDMTRKRLVDVCGEKHKTACFDMDTKTMRDVGAKLRKRDLSFSDVVPEKRYATHEVWK